MKNMVFAVAAVCAVHAALAAPWVSIEGTDLRYKGPGTVSAVTNPAEVTAILTNQLGVPINSIPAGTAVIQINNANNALNKIAPVAKSSSQTFALLVYGSPGVLSVDCGQANGDGHLIYLYVEQDVRKIMFKGMKEVLQVFVNNAGSAQGVQIMNLSKSSGGGPAKARLLTAPEVDEGAIHTVITSGKVKRLQSVHSGFGAEGSIPGAIMVGEDSPQGIIKTHPKGGMQNVLLCKGIAGPDPFDIAAVMNECIASNAVLPMVQIGQLKKANVKDIGPAVLGISLVKKIPASQVDKKVDFTEPVVGKSNFVQ